MGFFSKYNQKQNAEKGGTRFLRKGIFRRREGRTIVEKDKTSHVHPGVLFLWILFFCTVVYVAFFSIFFLIGEPVITGADQVSEESLYGSVNAEITGKYLGIFSKRNFFFIRPRHLSEDLLREYPLLASMNVTRVFPGGLRVEVTERKKIILWCTRQAAQGEESAVPIDRACFLINEAGLAQDAQRSFLPENISHVVFVTDMSGKEVSLGEKVFDENYGVFVSQASEMISEQLGLSLDPEYTTVSRFANELRAKTNEGWEVYMSAEIPLEDSVNVLKLLFEKELPSEKRANVAYIDLRTENRVYYTFRDGAVGGIIVPPSVEPEQKKSNKDTSTEKKKK